MLSPRDLGLPFSDWTPGQWETICQVVAHLAQPDAPPVILEAPTGIGKSAIALAVSRLLAPSKTVILTGTKQLQDQYRASFPDLVSVKGRGNFPCLLDARKTAADADCTVGLVCPHKGKATVPPSCPYFVQRAQAEAAPAVVTNYPFWLAQANHARRFRAELLICDEAHTLEDEVRRFASVALRASHSRLALNDDLPGHTRVADWKLWALETARRLDDEYAEAQRAKMNLTAGEHKYLTAVIALYDACQQLLDDPQADDDGWLVEPQSWGVLLRPVWVSPYVERYVARHAGKLLLMSATVLSQEVFAWTLGLPDASTFIQVPSRFPVENRPLKYCPVGRVKGGQQLQAILPTLVGAVDDILDRHPDERGLVHTVSYEIARALVRNSRHRRRLVTHDPSTRALALDRLRYSPGTVLISPSMATGVDLPYDLCRFQVICKLAFPYLGDPQIKKRMKLGPDGQPSPLAQRWYNWMTACQLVQTYGRGVRAVDDACVTYLLDGNFSWWKHTVRDMLPDWFTQAIQTAPPIAPNEPTDLDALLRQYQTAPLRRS